MVNRIATRATMSREKISHAVLLIGGNIAGRRVDRRIVRHIGILIGSKTKQAHPLELRWLNEPFRGTLS
jgi:hypothetical protein